MRRCLSHGYQPYGIMAPYCLVMMVVACIGISSSPVITVAMFGSSRRMVCRHLGHHLAIRRRLLVSLVGCFIGLLGKIGLMRECVARSWRGDTFSRKRSCSTGRRRRILLDCIPSLRRRYYVMCLSSDGAFLIPENDTIRS